MPQPDKPARPPEPPGNVLAAFWLCLVTGVVWIVHVAVSTPDRSTLTAAVQHTEGGVFSQSDVDSLVTTAIVLTIVFTVALAALCGFFGWKMRGGRNWARITLTWITGLSIVLSVGSGFWVAPTLAGLCVVAMFLPTSNAYFAASKAARR